MENKRAVGSRYEEETAAFLQKKWIPDPGEEFPESERRDRSDRKGWKNSGICGSEIPEKCEKWLSGRGSGHPKTEKDL